MNDDRQHLTDMLRMSDKTAIFFLRMSQKQYDDAEQHIGILKRRRSHGLTVSTEDVNLVGRLLDAAEFLANKSRSELAKSKRLAVEIDAQERGF